MQSTCPICNSSNIFPFYHYAAFTLMECKDCELLFQRNLTPAAAGLTDLFAQTYNADWVAMRDQYLRSTFLEHAAFYLMLLNIFTPEKGRLLEIGSGTGEFLFLAQAAGWDTVGVEPSAPACDYARQKYGLNLRNSFWAPALFKHDQTGKEALFDVVVFWHVLEHITNPFQFLEEIQSVLKPGGLLLCCVPNRHSLTNAVHGPNSPLYLEADHFFHYTRKSLTALLLRQSSLTLISLFSRQEPNRHASDLNAGQGRFNVANLTFPEIMTLMVYYQANFQGHELFCAARYTPCAGGCG